MNVQTHYAKYLSKPILNRISEKEVTLKGVRKEHLQYQNGKTEEELGLYSNFRIIVKNIDEARKNDLPDGIAVIKKGDDYINAVILTPENFLKDIKKIIYPEDITDEIMWENRRKRLDEFRIPRQLVMSAYFCAFKGNKNFTITLQNAGDIYGLDHATVFHAIKSINNYLDTDKVFKAKYAQLWNKVKEVNKNSDLHI